MPLIQKDLQQQLVSDRAAMRDTIVAMLRPLSGAQLNEHPEPGAWSIAEVLEHLLVTHEAYDGRMAEMFRTARADAAAPLREWQPTIIGNLLFKALESPRKVKTRPVFAPGATPRNGVLDAFAACETLGVKLMQDAAALDWRKVRIGSPALPGFMPKFNLGDVFRIHTIHVVRHASQIQRLMKQLA